MKARRPLLSRLRALATGLALGLAVTAPVQASVDIAQTPLFTTSTVPGNLLLVPSVEWPTINSVANLGDYDVAREYSGYFDPRKCYGYSYSATEAERHFYPSGTTATHTCSGTWSGNFLNWAATQTIDPFRKALTGGYRVRDTSTETWLEKARHDGQGGTDIFPDRRLPDADHNAALMQGATPFNADWMRMRIQGLGNKMYFRMLSDSVDENTVPYNPGASADHASRKCTDNGCEVSIRVKVCDTSIGVESNCRRYSDSWKPEGTIQQYAGRLRYSVFGYLNDHDMERDGGVLRAKAKYVGPTMPGATGEVDNPNKEWNGTTGVLIANPDSADATATSSAYDITISNSGVINYLNKFGQMTTKLHKSYDPVSELYYAAIRYLKNQGNVSAYSSMSGTSTNIYEMADGFPVITSWGDPVQHWCQPNVILGIGDIYTHRDKNLPGNTTSTDEPSTPSEVSSDTTVDVVTRTAEVATLEGITISTPFTGRENSAYIAGLAYAAHTRDIRPDLSGGKTTVSTYWVDVLEGQNLEGMARNQCALAAKYGGFQVPSDFDPDNPPASLPTTWWHTNGDTLTPFGTRGDGQSAFLRPDNFFTAGDASQMAAALTTAFQNIVTEMESSSTAAAASSAFLHEGTKLYITGFRSSDWSGMLSAYHINETDGTLGEPAWDAEAQLRAKTPAMRKIFTRTSTAGARVTLDLANLSAAQQAALNTSLSGTEDDLGANRIDWLRGDENAHASFRSRSGSGQPRLLGDIVNSNPQYAGDIDFGYRLLPAAAGGGSTYTNYRVNTVLTRPGTIYLGANDGMLHAFHGETGEELFAYMPSELLLPESGTSYARINRLMDPNYTHRYFVDGTAQVGDAYLGGAWKTVVVGSMGAGGRTVFALDVTNPSEFGTGNVMWEFTDPDLGYNVGQPAIVRMKDSNGTWAAVFGNGYNSANHRAVLYVVNLQTGTLISKIDTGVGSAASPNGLAAPLASDWGDNELRATTLYAGDLQGNMWRFDVSSTTASQWNQSTNRYVLFQARDPSGAPQPITARPGVRPTKADQALPPLVVAFGTGSYFRDQDKTSSQIQSIYSIVDYRNGTTVAPTDLLEQVITEQTEVTFGDETHLVRKVSTNAKETNHRGCRLDLIYNGNAEGERVLVPPEFPTSLRQDRVRMITMIPDSDPCGSGRGGFVMDLDLYNCGKLPYSVYGGAPDIYSGLAAGSGQGLAAIRRGGREYLYLPSGERLPDPDPEPSGRQSWRQLVP